MAMTTILGAGGEVGGALAETLRSTHASLRLVSRKPKPFSGAEVISADLCDREQTIAAVADSSVVYLVAGLKYDHSVWQEMWPRIMANVIAACKKAQARLIFFDNVYAYGSVDGPMTEGTPYAPCSEKGSVRAEIATDLMDEVKAGNLTAMIARSADFYGPNAHNGMPNLLVLEPFAKGATASWLVNANLPHSLTFTADAARGLAMLAERESCWNQVWHLPTSSNPPTGKEFIELAAAEFRVAPKYRVMGRALLRVAGLVDPVVRETYEMLYQYSAPYRFDSMKFASEFGFVGTPYAEGIRNAVGSYLAPRKFN